MGGKGKGKKRKRQGKGGGDSAGGDVADGASPSKRAPKRNDIWQEASGNWELTNEAYEAYYTRQRVCSEEEWPLLLQHLRTGLPVAIRVNGMRTGATSLCARLAEMQAACAGDSSRELYAPRPLTWYPNSLGWQWSGLERRTIKKDKSNKVLKEFLASRERSGLISRQEAVSMVPPLFLGVEPHHLVLDLCAAPGSKTAQMLEVMHWPSCSSCTAPPSGLVVANELQWKRANMLSHQVGRLCSPCAAVVNMDAQFFPELWEPSEDGTMQQLRYDRVLCDVPCSGDGTMRKTPFIWKSWTLKDGMSLHIRQLGILHRGLDLLKVGGRLVYSTCSLNPLEDEAVVSAALQRLGDAVALVPPPDLPGFKAACGLERWEVPDHSGGAFYTDYKSVPRELKEGKCKLLPSMFPPASAEMSASVRDNCRRMLPHLMDTGGFFCAIFEKRSVLKLSAKARREDRHNRRSQLAAAEGATADDAVAAQADAEGSGAAAEGEDPPVSEEAVAAESAENAKSAEAADETPAPPQGLKRVTKDYVQVDDDTARELIDFYGIDASCARRFVIRSDSDQRRKLFFLSDGLRRLLHAETKMPTRMVLCGVAAFEVAGSYHERASKWCPIKDGLPALVALGMRRQLTLSREMLKRLLREKELPLSALSEEATKGDVQGLEMLVDPAGGSSPRPGSVAVVLRREGPPYQAPFVVLASISDSMLELAVRSSNEVASLLQELEGQPPIEDILSSHDAKADAEDSEGAEAEPEAGADAEEQDEASV